MNPFRNFQECKNPSNIDPGPIIASETMKLRTNYGKFEFLRDSNRSVKAFWRRSLRQRRHRENNFYRFWSPSGPTIQLFSDSVFKPNKSIVEPKSGQFVVFWSPFS